MVAFEMVVVDELGERHLRLAISELIKLIETLGFYGEHKPLGDRVSDWGSAEVA